MTIAFQTGAALSVTGLTAGYGRTQVLHGVDFEIREGKLSTLLGANGAGKTTTLKAVAGLLPTSAGTVAVRGDVAPAHDSVDRIRQGVVYLPQDHAVFGDLSVLDNLLLGATLTDDRRVRQDRLELVLELFPRLRERQTQRASTMSGGEQRMLSVGITLMAGAQILLLDEPSLGLAPRVVDDLMTALMSLVTQGKLTVLLVEQDIGGAIRYADHVYVMRSGRIIWDGNHSDAASRTDWLELF